MGGGSLEDEKLDPGERGGREEVKEHVAVLAVVPQHRRQRVVVPAGRCFL